MNIAKIASQISDDQFNRRLIEKNLDKSETVYNNASQRLNKASSEKEASAATDELRRAWSVRFKARKKWEDNKRKS